MYEIKPEVYEVELLKNVAVQNISEVMSSVVSEIRDYYLSFFHPNYFKTVRVKSQMEASIFKGFLRSLPSYKEKPVLVIDAADFDHVEETLFSDVDMMRNAIDLDSSSAELIYSSPIMDFTPMIEKGEALGLFMRKNRYKIRFDILMVVSGLSEQLNLYNHLLMNMRHRSQYPIKRKIRHRLENSHIKNIANILKLDWESEEFMTTLNANSLYPIKKVVHPAQRGRLYSFFLEYENDFYITLPSYPARDNVGKSGMLDEAGRVTYSIEVDIDIPTKFIFLFSERLYQDMETGITNPVLPPIIPPVRDTVFEINDEDTPIPLLPNMKELYRLEVMATKTENKIDCLDIIDADYPNIRMLITYLLDKEISLETYIQMRAFKVIKNMYIEPHKEGVDIVLPKNLVLCDYTVDKTLLTINDVEEYSLNTHIISIAMDLDKFNALYVELTTKKIGTVTI
jgi:hypothetical protein